MDFSLSQEQLTFRDSVIEFAKKELNKDVMENDEKSNFPWENWKKCAEMGLLSLQVPEEYGGTGADLLTTVVALEALGYACKDSGLVHAIVTHTCCVIQISLFGNESQKKRYLPILSRGEKISAQAITEPDAGSDLISMITRAEKNGDGYVINGRKIFISNGPIAELALVFAVTNPQRIRFGGVSCFIVEKGFEGFDTGKPFRKMGLNTLQNGELVFDDCRVPAGNLLGGEGQGMVLFNEIIEWERALLMAAHLGTMERLLELSIKYSNERSQFGQSIAKYQSISNKIANMKVNVELGKLISYKVAWLKDQKKRTTLEASIGKLFLSESLRDACLDAIQIHGAYGYMKEFEIERELRDSIAATIYSGTSEMQRNIISNLADI